MIDWLSKKVFGEILPDDNMIRWLFATYEWMLRYRGGYDEFQRTRKLILPLNDNFPVSANAGKELAEEIFGHVKRYAQMTKWNCRLEEHDDIEMAERFREQKNGSQQSSYGAAGTFSMTWDQSDTVITYSPEQLHDLASLVATFAHELSHFYLATVPIEPPAGPTAEEHATDVCAVSMGFGIFLANTAQQYARGAVVGRKGYLGEVALSYALAIFTEAQHIPDKNASKHLKSNPRSYYSSAINDIRKRWAFQLESLRRVEAHDA